MHLERVAGAEGLTTALVMEPEAERDAAIDHVTEIIEPINPFPPMVVTHFFKTISLQKESKLITTKFLAET